MWVIWVVVVAALLVGVVLLALGRGDGLADEELDNVVVELPEGRPLTPADIESVRLPLALRGYRMAEVDRVLDRLSGEIASRDARIRQLQGEGPVTPR
jgi:DivIVA domain-containing protein